MRTGLRTCALALLAGAGLSALSALSALTALTALTAQAAQAAQAVQVAADRGVGATAGEFLNGLPPPAGLYDARLCVAVGTGPASCGTVSADIGDAGQALVRVNDIAYRLQVHAGQIGVTLFHGTMQIDGFFARYQWSGNHLLFSDPEKGTRYELKLGTRRFDTQ